MTANVQNQPFLDWLVAQGVEFANCGLHRFDDRHGGRGVRAHRNIVEHEVVISVPDDAVLMPETCSIAEVVCFVKLNCQRCTPWQPAF